MNVQSIERPWLRRYTKLTALATLVLVFLGGQVKSHDAGLAVPDWPTTFQYNMFLFPMEQWVGGIFHEHVHRLVASGVGFLTLVMAVWIGIVERRRWVRNLAFVALVAVIVQGILGGITVLYLLPTAVSAGHGVLAQTFLVIMIVIAYAYSKERQRRLLAPRPMPRRMETIALVMVGLIYAQLLLGALVRHTDSALAIPDFPQTGGQWAPVVDVQRLAWINEWRMEQSLAGADLPPVSLTQAMLHLFHRYGAAAVFMIALVLTGASMAYRRAVPGALLRNVALLDLLVLVQIALGAFTVWSMEMALIATFHVVTGAALLAVATLLALRVTPVTLGEEAASAPVCVAVPPANPQVETV